jgi:hypothetical protein
MESDDLIFQIMEELESLEETLNESIQESVGARTGKTIKGRKFAFEDEEDDDRYALTLDIKALVHCYLFDFSS